MTKKTTELDNVKKATAIMFAALARPIRESAAFGPD
ncbi:hypothetical protein ACVIU7_005297 [Bradyrhizobium liaoningense]|jgi:hypothetical protein